MLQKRRFLLSSSSVPLWDTGQGRELIETESISDRGSAARLRRFWCGVSTSGVQSVPLKLMPTIRSLGGILDDSLMMDAQFTSIANQVFYQLHQVWHLAPICFAPI